MAEYIDKQAVIDALKRLPHEYGTKEQRARTGGIAACQMIIQNLDAADVRPVVRGKWVWRHRHRGGFRRVSGEDDFGVRQTITVDERHEIDDPYCPFCGKLNESIFLNFCPNCGEDMREESPMIPGMCCDCKEQGPCCDYSENEDCLKRKEDGSCWVSLNEEDKP